MILFTSEMTSRRHSMDGNAPEPLGTMRSSSGPDLASRPMLRDNISSACFVISVVNDLYFIYNIKSYKPRFVRSRQ